MTNTGGPAYPTPWAGGSATEAGMTLRDHFAGQALVGLLASPIEATPDTIQNIAAHYAEVVYIYADAMIAEREKGGVK